MARIFPLDDRTIMVIEIVRKDDHLYALPYNLTDSVPATRRTLAALLVKVAADLTRKADELDALEAKP